MMVRRSTLALLVGLGFADLAQAGEAVKKGSLEFAEPWARATAPQQANSAAYMVITNHGSADRIVRAEAAVSRKVELHTHQVDAQGVARMIEIPAIELPANSTTELKPGGLHIMFIGLEKPLEAGRRFPLKLVLEKAGEVTLDVEVRATGAGPAMQHGTGHGMQHGKTH